MKDREFLLWIHERLEHVHGATPAVDYMHKLRAIIRDTPADKVSQNCGTGNGLDELWAIMRSNIEVQGRPR